MWSSKLIDATGNALVAETAQVVELFLFKSLVPQCILEKQNCGLNQMVENRQITCALNQVNIPLMSTSLCNGGGANFLVFLKSGKGPH